MYFVAADFEPLQVHRQSVPLVRSRIFAIYCVGRYVGTIRHIPCIPDLWYHNRVRIIAGLRASEAVDMRRSRAPARARPGGHQSGMY